jgi:biopolymer transport protein ExbD
MKVRMATSPKPRIEILPLIDIVFLLLVFFIYAMLSMAVHKGLPVLLPESKAVDIEKRTILSVTIRKDGGIFVNDQPATMATLGDRLKAASADAPETGVLLFGDREISYQQLFNVLDVVKNAGFSKVSLQADRLEE